MNKHSVPLLLFTIFASMVLVLNSAIVIPVHAQTPSAMPLEADTYDEVYPQDLVLKDIIGESAVVISYETGRILFEKNAEQKMYPASTTKIMTCMLALEYGHLNDTVTIPKDISKTPAGSSLVPLKSGEKMPFIDLLYGLMVPSGNDAAIAVAVIVAGSVDNFVRMMNERARALGCKNTHFTNPHGFHDETHYTTVLDMAIIAHEAMKNPIFREIVSAKGYTMTATTVREKLKLATRNSMFIKTSDYYYEPMIGIKTGWHSKAGQCFVGAAKKDGVTLISATFKSTQGGKWTDTKRLMEFGFSQYKTYFFDQIYAENPLYATIKNADIEDPGSGLVQLTVVPGGSISSYSVSCLPDEYELTSKDTMSKVSVQYSHPLVAPIRQGDILGLITLPSNDGGDLSGTIIASRNVAELKPVSTLGKIAPWVDTIDLSLLWMLLGLFTVMTIMIVCLRLRHAVRRRRRIRELRRQQQLAYIRYRQMH